MATALGSVGGGGSASELRSDAGIFFQYGVEESLKRDPALFTQITDQVIVAVPALSTTTSVIFSIPEDHYVLAISALPSSNPANFEWASLLRLETLGTMSSLLFFCDAAAMRTLVAGVIPVFAGGLAVLPNLVTDSPCPLFSKQQVDYRMTARSTVGGAVTVALYITTARCPKGVEIPH